MIYIYLLFIILILTATFYYWRLRYFYRDPERIAPPGNNIIAPADGKIIYIRKVLAGSVPVTIKNHVSIPLNELTGFNGLNDDYYIVGTFMYPTSVHVNRSPIEGKVSGSYFTRGKNKPMTLTWWRAVLGIKPYDKYSNYIKTNERNTLIISNGNISAAITQIADIYVNKVECWVRSGEKLEKGQRFGRIVFGSQVDLLIPIRKDVRVVVKEGDKVLAGESIIATYN